MNILNIGILKSIICHFLQETYGLSTITYLILFYNLKYKLHPLHYLHHKLNNVVVHK